MALDDDIRTLSGVTLFQGLADEHLRLLAFGADSVQLPEGQRLYREGDVAETAFIVVRGRIGLLRRRPGGNEQVGQVSSGTILSEFALIAESQRLTDAVALTDATLLRIDRRSFLRILQEYPALASELYNRISDDLDMMIRRLERVSQRLET